MADNRIAYGLAKKYGIDTKGMSPKEVWEALKGKGITQANAQEKYSEQSEKREKTEKIYNSDGIGGKHIPTEAEKKRLKELGIEENRILSETDKKPTKEFIEALLSAKQSVAPKDSWRVSSPSAEEFDEEHPNARKYVTKGGSTIAITPDGDIVGVCKKRGDTVSGSELLAFAVENGGKKLDAFSGLYGFYSKCGFEPVSWTPFDEQYAPSGWEKERDEEEPVIFWKYTGNRTKLSAEEFLNSVKPSESYDEAKQKRDDEVEV